MNDTRI